LVGHYNSTMFNAVRILVSTLVLGTAGLLLGGCGQTGSLYLPPAVKSTTPAPKPVSASETTGIKSSTGE
jgi:predicted small lipoprotein YifL